MTGAEHIIAYAESDAKLYAKLVELARRSRDGERDGYLLQSGRFYAASNLVMATYHEGTRCRDIYPEDIKAEDFANAILLALAWQAPE